MSRVLGFGGYAKAGKDTAADFLVSEYGYKKTYMSKPLEQALLTLDPYIPEVNPENLSTPLLRRYSLIHERDGYDKSKVNPEVRRLLQKLGTEVGREMFGDSVWVDIATEEIQSFVDSGYNVVVTGIRFPNEFSMIHNFPEGETVWIDGGTRVSSPINEHVSDNTLNSWDFDRIVYNDGTVEDLHAKLRSIYG